MRYLLQPLLLFILLTLVNSQCDQESSIISFGEGIATGIPDIATLYVLITNTSPTATTATRNIRETLNQILRITDWYGVPISNIEIVDINLAPIMDQSNVVGFQANQTLGIKGISIISPVASLIGTLYEQLAKLSGLVLSGLTFQFSNAEGVKDQARRNAYSVAESYTKIYGTLAGFGRNSIVEVKEEVQVLTSPNKYNMTELIGFKEAYPGIFTLKVRTSIRYSLR